MGQNISFDDIRRQLCFDPVKYVAGSWFRLPENEVRSKSKDKPFALRKAEAGKGGRRVIIYQNATNPNVGAYPRTSQRECVGQVIKHDEHVNTHGRGSNCAINKDGTVILIPYVVPLEQLTNDTFSCQEPENSELFQKSIRIP